MTGDGVFDGADVVLVGSAVELDTDYSIVLDLDKSGHLNNTDYIWPYAVLAGGIPSCNP